MITKVFKNFRIQNMLRILYLFQRKFMIGGRWVGGSVLGGFNKIQNIHCMLYFSNFFNFLTLVENLFDRVIYCLGTVQS